MSVDKIKNLIKRNKKIVENFSYLSILQIFNMALPLITYPYLIRVLGAELYGLIIFAQTVVSYFTIFINYGFNISGTKDIAVNKHDKNKVSEIASSILTLQAIIVVLCFIVFILMLGIFPEMKQYKALYLITFILVLDEILFPRWFFQGIEKMKFITYINLVVRLIFLCLIFFFVKSKDDYLLVPLFNAIGIVAGGFLALYIIFVKYGVRFRIYPPKTTFRYLKTSTNFFLSKLALLIKDKSVIIIIGILFSKTIVAYYDLALKLVGVFVSLYQNIPTVILPRLMQERNYSMTRKIFLFTFFASGIYYGLMVLFSDLIIRVLAGNDMLAASVFVYIVGALVMINPLNTLLNYYLIINGKDNLMLKSILISFIFFIIISIIGIMSMNIYILLFSMIISGILESIYKVVIFKNDKELYKFIAS